MPAQEREPSALEEQPADSQANSVRAELVEARAQAREAALRYREARLAAAPHIPPDLVPGETIDEIDRQLGVAQKVVARLRQELAAEVRKEEPPARPLRPLADGEDQARPPAARGAVGGASLAPSGCSAEICSHKIVHELSRLRYAVQGPLPVFRIVVKQRHHLFHRRFLFVNP